VSSVQADASAQADAADKARFYGYVERVLSGEMPDLEADTGAFLVGMLVGVMRQLHKFTAPQAEAAVRRWTADQVKLWGSLAATTDREAEEVVLSRRERLYHCAPGYVRVQ
jgi:hypothetical protein